MNEHIDLVTITYFECQCCGAREDEDNTYESTFARAHPRPNGGMCTPEYRNDPSTTWMFGR